MHWPRYGIAPLEVSDAEIEQRCVLSLINIGAQILDEGLAYRAADIDVVWTAGYGFPRWRGGPMYFADTVGIDRVVTQIDALAATGFRRLLARGTAVAPVGRNRTHVRRVGPGAGKLNILARGMRP